MSGSTSWAADADGVDHSHAWVRNANGGITIAESAGHTHTILDESGLDSAPPTRQDDDTQPRSRGRRAMPPITKKPIDKTDEKKLIEAAAEEVAKAEQRADAAEESFEKEKKRADSAEARATSLEEEVKALKETRLDDKELTKRDGEIAELKKKITKLQGRVDVAESPERFAKGVARRVKIITAAAPILGETMVADSITDIELMCAVVEKLRGVDIRKDDEGNERSIDYVTARFDAAVDAWSSGNEALDKLRDLTRGVRVEEPREDAASARRAYVERQQNAWKPAKTAAR